MEKIKGGEKRATLRLGIKDYKEGERVIVRCGTTILGVGVITKVSFKRFSELKEEDAKIDGFDNLDDLRKALNKFYGEFSDDAIFTQLFFEMEE